MTKNAHDLSMIIKWVDLLMVFLGGALSYVWRFGLESLPPQPIYSMLMSTGGLLLIFILNETGVYRSWRGGDLVKMFGLVTMGWIFVFLSLLGFLFILKASDSFSRGWFVAWAASTAFLLMSARLAFYILLRWMRLRGLNHKRVVLVGQSNVTQELIRRVRAAGWTGFDIIALFDDQLSSVRAYEDLAVHDDMDDLEHHLEAQHVDEVWVTLPLKDEDRVRDLLFRLRHSTVNIRYVPGMFTFHLFNHGVSEIVGMPMLDLSISPMSGINRLIKAAEDRLLALLILILISPLMLAIALVVKMSSSGPVLFKQSRLGWDGREIIIYKFRTMIVHEEPKGHVTQARKGDPRITQIGAFLRRTSLDELPQFINVLQGRMSIVGPRPHAIEHNEQFKDLVDDYMKRHKVKPGITGWAQVNGYRGETDTLEKMQKRVEYDLYYIEHWSLLFDLRII
ncbi:MAG: undecaprenyl-phosphate glucose phosphotransferase, partial [Halothiobacillus sp.]|nr:undecaprenyl-phosphate glucose phosphotransferase [Halothiobacillus sp.]